MNLVSKAYFADQCCMSTNKLAVYIGRNKVIVDSKTGKIDMEHNTNDVFLKRYGRKVFSPTGPAEDVAKPAGTAKQESSDEPNAEEKIPDLDVSEKLLKHRDAQKREKEIIKIDLDIQKKQGVVVLTALIKPVFLQHNKSMVMAFKIATDKILTEYAKVKDFSLGEIAGMRTFMLDAINEAARKSIEISSSEVDSIVKTFSDKRGIGERS